MDDSDEPLFEISFKRWPPIYRYKSKLKGHQTASPGNIVSQRAATFSDQQTSNLLRRDSQTQQPNRPNTAPPPEQGIGLARS
jgi:hypothetical protein